MTQFATLALPLCLCLVFGVADSVKGNNGSVRGPRGIEPSDNNRPLERFRFLQITAEPSSMPSLPNCRPKPKSWKAPTISPVPTKSFAPSSSPSFSSLPTMSNAPSLVPSVSNAPSNSPRPTKKSERKKKGKKSKKTPYPTAIPTTSAPSISPQPSSFPSLSSSPTKSPSPTISHSPTFYPTISHGPTVFSYKKWYKRLPFCTDEPTEEPSLSPTISPKPTISLKPTLTMQPTLPPTVPQPTFTPSLSPTNKPTDLVNCDALKAGQQVTRGNPVDGVVEFEIVIEDTTDLYEVLGKIEDLVQKEVVPTLAGCEEQDEGINTGRMLLLLRLLEGEDTTIIGANLGNIYQRTGATCKTSDVPEGSTCYPLASNYKIRYHGEELSDGGKATLRQRLAKAFQTAKANGKFNNVDGLVGLDEVNSSSSGQVAGANRVNSSYDDDDGRLSMPMKLVIGLGCAGLVVLALLLIRRRRRRADRKEATIASSSRGGGGLGLEDADDDDSPKKKFSDSDAEKEKEETLTAYSSSYGAQSPLSSPVVSPSRYARRATSASEKIETSLMVAPDAPVPEDFNQTTPARKMSPLAFLMNSGSRSPATKTRKVNEEFDGLVRSRSKSSPTEGRPSSSSKSKPASSLPKSPSAVAASSAASRKTTPPAAPLTEVSYRSTTNRKLAEYVVEDGDTNSNNTGRDSRYTNTPRQQQSSNNNTSSGRGRSTLSSQHHDQQCPCDLCKGKSKVSPTFLDLEEESLGSILTPVTMTDRLTPDASSDKKKTSRYYNTNDTVDL